MPQNWKTVRVFISSTFRDMHEERNYLINEVFLELRDWCAKHGLHLIDVDLRWGVTEEEEKQDKVLGICLDEIQRCRPFFIGLLGERYGLIPPEYYVPDEPQYDWVRDFEKGHSLTALEIYHGVLRDAAMKARAFFYFRDPKFINDLPQEYRVDFLPESDGAKQKLLRLKDEIRAHCPVYENYACTYGGLNADGRVTLTQLEDLGKRILTDLKTAISEEHRLIAPQTNTLETERGYHETFIENSTKRYIGRRALLDELCEYSDSEKRTPLVVTGGAGCGKSALLAKFAKEYAEKREVTFVLTHFIGVSPGSTDIFRTLLRLSRELKQKFHIAEDVPADYYELRQVFPKFLESAAANGKLLLIVDALDQLDESSLHHSVEWLPDRLPHGLKIIVSTLEGKCLDLLLQHNAALQKVIVGALTGEERQEIVRQTLDDYRKKLEETSENNQMGLLLNKAESDHPLYLIVACEEMRLFGEFGRVTEKIEALGNNVEELFGQVIGRLENLHGEAFIRNALSLIECVTVCWKTKSWSYCGVMEHNNCRKPSGRVFIGV
ncbi:MAG TPA: AAA family ATPase [Pyrinomonadaceae bacterium]|nr:AAA family ATPase [Pyrinomonadaceae bacterium]